MSILIFIVMLVVLIVGHEYGHLIVAKLSGMKVPEFGIGFPPRLFGKRIGETEYTVNALPFGGFVKIVGEDDADLDDPRAFHKRPKILQAATLFAGPFSNILMGLVLSTAAFMIGVPAATGDPAYTPYIHGASVVVAEVIPGSPAEHAGLKEGDRIVSVSAAGKTTAVAMPDDVTSAVNGISTPVTLAVERAGKDLSFTMTPATNVVPDDPSRLAIGIGPLTVGTLSYPIGKAFVAGVQDTYDQTKTILGGLFSLVGQAFQWKADLSGLAGPVGIVSLVGTAAGFGFGSLLSFAALISVNLGIVNLLPFPALDGGRLAFLAYEAVTRRRIPAKVADGLNIGGFAILIILMIAITAHDIWRLVH